MISGASAAGLAALADGLAADPPAAAVLVLEAPAAGPDAQPLRGELVALLARILGDLDADGGADAARLRPEIVGSGGGLAHGVRAGALHELLHRRIARGETAGLPALVPDVARALALVAAPRR